MAAQQIKAKQIDDWFAYRPTPDDKIINKCAIRTAAKVLATIIVEETPQGPDQHAAIRKLREAVMTADAAIDQQSL